MPIQKQKINRLLNFFKSNKIKTQSHFPSSMVFVQNPLYANHKKIFNKIQKHQGITDGDFNKLIEIDEMGLTNIANLYEKWCLLQIINILLNSYKFYINENWRENLIHSVLNNTHNIQFVFTNNNTQQKVILTYEMELSNGKRPDFVVDLYSKKYFKDSNNEWCYTSEERVARLVLDAKFKSQSSEQQIKHILDDLYHFKDYGENNRNSVFILHPTPNLVTDKTSPLPWGKHCNYGQSNFQHKKGYILLSPSLKHPNTQEHLQRLFVLFFQQNMQILDMSWGYWVNMGCITCGKPLQITSSQTQNGQQRWEMLCPSCKQFSLQTVCYNCKTILFKNGLKWTYHRTKAEQISNIICPNCESFLQPSSINISI